MAATLPRPNPERDTRQAIGAPLGRPLDAFRNAAAYCAFPADLTQVRIGLDAPRSLSQRTGHLRTWSAVVGQEVEPGMSQHHEQLRLHVQLERIGITPRPDIRLHVTSFPALPVGYAGR
jgi:hypothetical protein